ncbi:Protein gir2 [Tilletia horrida]|uniref:Protein gir2 n=1 Tax=Tilletia horrida TaxID=155126 RepID=A0AAN6G6C8_9BASI|nr:Protein gir2 [Tilletia horrida]KAK0521691.1 Protein gir2 [Tilletia horrida]KAK0523904.1 Protein gir2 [Tilletia horrida]
MPSAEEHAQTIADELEVLQSIYMDDELQKLSDDVLKIRIEPDRDALTGEEREGAPTLSFQVTYTEEYPDALPQMEIETVEGELDESATEELLSSVREMGESDCLGMAMVFTLASHLREELTSYLRRRVQLAEEARLKARDEEIEAEQQKFKGTAVTVERFAEWRKKFEAERAAAKAAEEEALMKGMSAKEKEEFRRMRVKPTGRQIFQRSGPASVAEEEGEDDEGGQEVDWSLYSREARSGHREQDEEEDGRIELDLSDED